jgi:hypothetical protein
MRGKLASRAWGYEVAGFTAMSKAISSHFQ